MKKAILMLMLILCPIQMKGQEIDKSKSAEQILAKLIAESDINDEKKQRHLTFKRRVEIDDVDISGKFKSRKSQELIEIYPDKNGRSVEELLEKDGKPAKGKPATDSDMAVNFNRALGLRYEITLDSSILMEDNKPFLVISFKPKGSQPKNSRIDDLLNNLEGKIYIDLVDFYIKRIEARLVRPVGWAIGIVKVHEANIVLLQEKRTDLNNIVVLKSMGITDRYTFFGANNNERRLYSYEDYALADNTPDNPPK